MQVWVASFYKELPPIPVAGDIARIWFGAEPIYETGAEWLFLNVNIYKSPVWAIERLLKNEREHLKDAYPGQGLYAIAVAYKPERETVPYLLPPSPRNFGEDEALLMREVHLQIQGNHRYFKSSQSVFRFS